MFKEIQGKLVIIAENQNTQFRILSPRYCKESIIHLSDIYAMSYLYPRET